MNYDEALKYYNLIKSDENLQDERFEIFFNYIEKTWMGYYENKKNKVIYKTGKYPFELWNYYDKLQINLEDKDNENINSILENKIEKYLSYTNNNLESINSYIKNQILFGTSPNLFNEKIKIYFKDIKEKELVKKKILF